MNVVRWDLYSTGYKMPPVDRNNPVRAKSSDSRVSFMEFVREYPDDAACLNHLWRTRYAEDGENAECPKCEQLRSFKRYETSQRRQSWTCTACATIHPTAGTIFHKSSTSLHLWFYAIYLVSSSRCGIAAKQLEREIGVNYKTAPAAPQNPRRTYGVMTTPGSFPVRSRSMRHSSAGRFASPTARRCALLVSH